MIAGVDEAGRGPVIGPMVMAAVLVKNDKELPEGIRDSKLLSPAQRTKLYETLATITHIVKVVHPEEIDTWVNQGKLNWLEAEKTAEMLSALHPKHAIIDCPAKNVAEYKEFLKQRVPKMKITLEFKADARYPVVAAASIIAKVTRDRIIEQIKEETGHDFGSGYTSDPKTQAFLKKLPKDFLHIRKSWKTYKDAVASTEQQSLL